MRMISTAALAALTSVALVTTAFAQSTPLPSSITETAPPTSAKPREVRTARGVAPDKPFSLTYPADLNEHPPENYDLRIKDKNEDFDMTLMVEPAAAGVTTDSEVRAFDAAEFLREVHRFAPRASLIVHRELKLPAGSAQFIHWSEPQTSPSDSHYIEVRMFDGGRSYRMFFSFVNNVLKQHREAVGFMLANFSTSNAARPCCSDPVPLP